jgi:hypothetical protein
MAAAADGRHVVLPQVVMENMDSLAVASEGLTRNLRTMNESLEKCGDVLAVQERVILIFRAFSRVLKQKTTVDRLLATLVCLNLSMLLVC